MASVDVTMTSDTQMLSNNATTNYDTTNNFQIGEHNALSAICRSLIKPNWSVIPAGQLITAATLKMTPISDASSNARTMYAHRVLRTVNFSQATWNVYSTGNNWGTAGCSNNTTDYDGAVVIGSASQPASPTLNSALSFTMALDPVEVQKFYDGTYVNNGIVLFVDTQVDDDIGYASTDHATSGYRPIVTVTYESRSTFFFLFG